MADIVKEAETNTSWYVKAILQLGVPAALCIFLVYYITLDVNAKMKTQGEHIIAISNMMNTHADSSGRFSAETLYILRTMCVNSGKTSLERERCNQNPH